MAEQYYALYLGESTSLSSWNKLFVGTKSDILDAAERMRGIDRYQGTVAVIDAYFRGDSVSMPRVGYLEKPMLSMVELVSASSLELGETQLVYMQYSRSPHFIRFDSATVEQIIFCDGLEPIRMIRAAMKNLGLANAASEYERLEDGFKGHGCLLDVRTQPDGSVTLQNRLFVLQERGFWFPEELEEELEADTQDPSTLIEAQKSKMQDPGSLNFDEIFVEIFGEE